MSTCISAGHIVGIFAAAFLFAFSVAVETPTLLLSDAQHMLASVGVSAAIAPNPYNSVAEQLSNKEKVLMQKEADLTKREQALVVREQTPLSKAGVASLALSVLLTVLIGINFYLDAKRRNKASVQYSVSLK